MDEVEVILHTNDLGDTARLPQLGGRHIAQAELVD
jgi:hypothetical protein